jgi:hypothetical protein
MNQSNEFLKNHDRGVNRGELASSFTTMIYQELDFRLVGFAHFILNMHTDLG